MLTERGATDRLRFSNAMPPSLKLLAIALTLLLNEPTPRWRPPFHGSGGNWRRFTVSGVIVVHWEPVSTIIVTGDPLTSAATSITLRGPISGNSACRSILHGSAAMATATPGSAASHT